MERQIVNTNHHPDGWRVVRLGDVAEINRRQWDLEEDAAILYLDLTAVVAPGRLLPPQELAAKDAPSRARRRVRSGDVLVSTVRPYLKGFARVPQAPDNLVASTGFAVLTPRPEVDRSLVYHQVMAPPFVRHLEATMTGQAYPAVRPSDVHSYRFALPPLPEQRAIAAVLDAIDDAIERTEAVITATQRLRGALLHELFTRGVPGWHSEWRDIPGLGTVPAAWRVVRLGEVATLQRGVDLPIQDRVQGSIPVYGSNGILGSHAQALHPGPGVITGRSGSIGVVYFSTGSYWPLNTTLYVRDFHGNSKRFIYYLLSHLRLERFAASTGVPSLNRNFVHPQPVALPPLPEQQAIADALDGVGDAIELASEDRGALQSLKASASDALLSGRVRVREG